MSKSLAIFVSGGGSNLQAIIDAIADGRINAAIRIVVSSSTDAYAITRAENHGIPVFVAPLANFPSREERDAAILRELDNYDLDYIVLCGYLGILTPAFFRKFKRKIINIHPALLPRHGGKGMFGLNVHREVLRLKEPFTGATVHFVDEGIDTGEIIGQKSMQILPDETPESLQKKVLENCEHILLPEVLARLCKEQSN